MSEKQKYIVVTVKEIEDSILIKASCLLYTELLSSFSTQKDANKEGRLALHDAFCDWHCGLTGGQPIYVAFDPRYNDRVLNGTRESATFLWDFARWLDVPSFIAGLSSEPMKLFLVGARKAVPFILAHRQEVDSFCRLIEGRSTVIEQLSRLVTIQRDLQKELL